MEKKKKKKERRRSNGQTNPAKHPNSPSVHCSLSVVLCLLSRPSPHSKGSCEHYTYVFDGDGLDARKWRPWKFHSTIGNDTRKGEIRRITTCVLMGAVSEREKLRVQVQVRVLSFKSSRTVVPKSRRSYVTCDTQIALYQGLGERVSFALFICLQ